MGKPLCWAQEQDEVTVFRESACRQRYLERQERLRSIEAGGVPIQRSEVEVLHPFHPHVVTCLWRSTRNVPAGLPIAYGAGTGATTADLHRPAPVRRPCRREEGICRERCDMTRDTRHATRGNVLTVCCVRAIGQVT